MSVMVDAVEGAATVEVTLASEEHRTGAALVSREGAWRTGGVRPLSVDSRPLSVDSRPLSVDPRPLSVDSRPLSVDPRPSEEEVRMVRGRTANQAEEIASKIISRLPRLPKKPTNNP